VAVQSALIYRDHALVGAPIGGGSRAAEAEQPGEAAADAGAARTARLEDHIMAGEAISAVIEASMALTEARSLT